MPIVNAADYPNMKVGDLILYSGRSLSDKLIQWKTASPYSHVAIVCEIDSSAHVKERVLIIETSISTKLNNYNRQKAIQGVQIHFLEQWIDAYKDRAEIWWLPLSTNLSIDGQSRMQIWMREVFKQQVTYSYQKILLLALDRPLEVEFSHSNFSSLFCSELVFRALQIAGVVDPFLCSSGQTPQDIINLSCFDKHSLKSLTQTK